MDADVSGFGLNERSWAIADSVVTRAAELRVLVHTSGNGARILDAGIETAGGLAAGRALAEMCMGGLGHVDFVPLSIGTDTYMGVQVWTDHPAISSVASQYAGWAVKVGTYFAMGSGPLRAHARVERELFAKLRYEEHARRGVLVLESRQLPTDEVIAWVSEKAELPPAQLTFAAAPTASLAGSVQVVARALEAGLHKMDTLGFDVTRVVSGVGTAPLPPVAKDDLRAIGRTNDCVLYGGQARFTVHADDDELDALAARLPASASDDYGMPFVEIFRQYDNDFYRIDPMLFSPGEVWLTSATSGRTFHAGGLAPEVLRASLYGG
ncbi:MAG TPA: methenyltetrahydromethanopterin cyclohydrolase [Gemmatimonadaceae bacterium]|nr:methenyltetrahydromethanopterin cyclohydrolase [Gemmatimonadaceae bacterium]